VIGRGEMMKRVNFEIVLAMLTVILTLVSTIQIAPSSPPVLERARANSVETLEKPIVSEHRPIVSEHRITTSELEELKQSIGVWQANHDYNQLIYDHGTGLRSPTNDEWATIMNNSFMAENVQVDSAIQATSSVDLTTTLWFPPIGNQGSQGSCVAFAVGYYTKTFQEAKEHGWDVSGGATDKIMSPSFLYNLINYGVDGGSWYSDAVSLVCSVGISSLQKMPYTSDYTGWPSEQAWREATLYRGNHSGIKYMNLQDDAGLANLKNWLASDNLAILSVDASKIADPFWGTSRLDGNDMLTLDNYVNPSTNHAGTIVGYNDNFAYTEGGQTHYGAFKIANSWGVGWPLVGWEHVRDGCYWISYEAMKQRVLSCMFYDDIVGYQPELTATFEMSHSKRAECIITVGVGNVSNPIVTKSFSQYINGGFLPFCRNRILFDITEFRNVIDIDSQQCFLRVSDYDSSTTGAILYFAINNAVSSDPPVATINNQTVFANLTLHLRLNVPEDFPTIQKAIDAAYVRGNIISVAPGTYYEHLVLNKSISLVGDNKNTVIIDGNLTWTVINITASNVNVNGFTIRRSGSGWPNYTGIFIGRMSAGNNVSDNIITENYLGVYLEGSSNNTINGNMISNNAAGISSTGLLSPGDGVYNNIFGNNVTDNYEGISLSSSFNILRNNRMVGNVRSFACVNMGGSLLNYVNDIDNSNTVNGKPIYYWVNKSDEVVPLDAGYVALINCTRVTVQGLNLTNNGQGVLLAYTKGSTITKSNMVNNAEGIDVEFSSNNTLSENFIGGNNNGIFLYYSSNNGIAENNVTANSQSGIYATSSSGNHIEHNSLDNTKQVLVDSSVNVWDDGYPSGGNYWSDYSGVDVKSGLAQDFPGSDGIGDTSYTLDVNNQDHYPLTRSYAQYVKKVPYANFTCAPTEPFVYSTVTFNASASFDLNGNVVNYAWNFGDETKTAETEPTATYTYTLAGTYTVTLTITDNDGFTDTATKPITVLHDGTPPTTSHDYDDAWYAQDFVIILRGTDNESGLSETYYRVNNGSIQNIRQNGQPLLTSEGTNSTLEYWSIDNAGNEELPHKMLTQIKLDKIAPNGSVIINYCNAYTTSTAVTLTLTYSDVGGSDVDQVRYSNDGSAWTDWETTSEGNPWTLTSDDGPKAVYYQIKDNAGNTATFSDSIVLDTTAPSGFVSVNSGATYTTSTGVALTLSTTDLNGVAEMAFSTDGTTWSAWEAYSTSKSWTLTGGDGTKTVYAKFKDNAGLESSICEDSTILDTVAPVTDDDYDSLWHTSDFTVTLTASDGTSGVSDTYYKVNGGVKKTVNVDGQPQITTESATNSLEYWSIDGAGNEETRHTLTTVMLDKTVPIATITTPEGQNLTVDGGTNMTFNASSSSDNIGIVSYAWDFGDGATATGEIATHAYSSSGNFTTRLTIQDAAGNTGTDTLRITVVRVLQGDVNGDSTVDNNDALILSNAFEATPDMPNWNSNADVNGDNVVDIYDAIILAKNYGKWPDSLAHSSY
jgi:parallel beta-helix repeat protein